MVKCAVSRIYCCGGVISIKMTTQKDSRNTKKSKEKKIITFIEKELLCGKVYSIGSVKNYVEENFGPTSERLFSGVLNGLAERGVIRIAGQWIEAKGKV
jgi:hypothetical protein